MANSKFHNIEHLLENLKDKFRVIMWNAEDDACRTIARDGIDLINYAMMRKKDESDERDDAQNPFSGAAA